MTRYIHSTLYTVLTIAISLVLTGITSAVALAHSDNRVSRDPILSGLWAGSNFDLSGQNTTPEALGGVATTPTPPPASGQNYAALGDSVAAGAGLTSNDTQCGRSSDAYPNQVAADQNLTLIHQACGGATVGDLFSEQGVDGPNIEPQLDAAFASGTPQLITITAGANDVHWDEFLRKCYAQTCGTHFDDRVASLYFSWLELKLDYLFYEIERRSNGTPPTVVFTGYYNPLSEVCTAVEPRLTTDEINWLSLQLNTLNQTLKTGIADHSYAKFVPVDFTGHDVCSADSWLQGPDDPAPFHPTTEGQQVIARSVLDVL